MSGSTNQETQYIVDDGSTAKYFTQIPHMADDDLAPYEYKLYGHYKRVCGLGGECYETTKTTATLTKMSESQVKLSRKQLESDGWIVTTLQGETGNQRVHVRILDRWVENMTRYSRGGVIQ